MIGRFQIGAAARRPGAAARFSHVITSQRLIGCCEQFLVLISPMENFACRWAREIATIYKYSRLRGVKFSLLFSDTSVIFPIFSHAHSLCSLNIIRRNKENGTSFVRFTHNSLLRVPIAEGISSALYDRFRRDKDQIGQRNDAHPSVPNPRHFRTKVTFTQIPPTFSLFHA